MTPSGVPRKPVVRSIDELDEYWPVVRLEVGGAPHGPDWQQSRLGAVWIGNEQLGVIHQISPRSNRLVRNIDVGEHPCNGLAVGYGSVWVPLCGVQSVARISVRTPRDLVLIPAAVNVGGEGLISIGVGRIWLIVEEGARLIGIDPTSNTISASAQMPKPSYGTATGFGSVWVTNHNDGTVTRVDPGSMKTEVRISVGLKPLFLAVGAGSVWVLNQGDGSVSRIDPVENRVVATIELGVPGIGGCIAADQRTVWVSVPGTPLTRIDARSNLITHQFNGSGGDCLSIGFGSVWLSNHEFGSVWRVTT